ncbi:MAG: DUF3365 domain-containing protein [Microcystaceae cyanobacterium]
MKPFSFVKLLGLALVTVATMVLIISCNSVTTAPKTSMAIAPEAMTDYIYDILKAERSVYGSKVVQRLKEEGVVMASENWELEKALPLPAQMFRMTAQEASKNNNFNYGSISPWNLNEGNAPRTEFEQTAMDKVLETEQPYKGYQTINGKKYFSAVYPDKATTEACVSCHNSHPVHKQRYPDKVFKVGDVMGGVLINLPLEKSS